MFLNLWELTDLSKNLQLGYKKATKIERECGRLILYQERKVTEEVSAVGKRILIIEDEEAINELVAMNLQAAGYETVSFFDGQKAFDELKSEHTYDLAVLDIMLPGKNGFELLTELKIYQIPVICLTARGDIASKAKGLLDGAEDYMVKPFEMLELLIRIDKIIKRFSTEENRIEIGNVQIYTQERKVIKAGEEIHLKPMEFDCLLLLVTNRNIALTREEFIRHLWNTDFEGETRTVDAHIGRLRKKLDWQDMIRTIPRIGYRLEARKVEQQP